nr:MAG TPA: hypothetical protein [Caudoviricetes sp.]
MTIVIWVMFRDYRVTTSTCQATGKCEVIYYLSSVLILINTLMDSGNIDIVRSL